MDIKNDATIIVLSTICDPMTLSGPGVGVTKPISSVPLFS